MTQVLFVDDEPSILEGLRLFLPWDELGFRVISAAGNGAEALAAIEHYKPGLVISDIRMPVVDGLTLIEEAKLLSPLTKFIVLSSYQDFACAQKAIGLGALGYLTKPLDADELLQAVTKAAVTLRNEQNTKNENLAFIRYAANQIYSQILSGTNSRRLALKARQLFGLGGEPANIQLLRFTIRPLHDSPTPYEPDERVYIHLLNLLRLPDENCLFCNGFGNYILLLHEALGLSAFGDNAALEASLRGRVAQTVFCDDGFAFTVERVLVTSPQNGDILSAVRACGAQLDTLQSYAILHPESKVIRFDAIENWQPESAFIPSLPFEPLLNAVKGAQEAPVRQAVDAFFQQMRQSKVSWPIYALCLYRLADLLGKTAYAYGAEADGAIRRFIASIENMHTGEESALLMCLQVWQKLNQHNDKPIALLENEIAAYIKDNFKSNLSMQNIGAVFSLPPAVVSKTVKKLTGLKFNEYINTLRIEQAKKLIASSPMKMTAVSEAAGYSDYAYFTGKFKELTGITPSEYKKKFL